MYEFVIIICASVILILILLSMFVFFKKFTFAVEIKKGNVIVYCGFKKLKIKIYDSVKQKKYVGKHEESAFYKIPKPKTIKQWAENGKKLYESEKDNVIVLLKEAGSRLDFSRIDFCVSYGFGDAAITGISNGAIWAIITAVMNLIKKYVNVEKILNVAIEPVYTDKCFDYHATLNFKARIFSFRKTFRMYKEIYKRNKETISVLKG